MTNEYAHLKRLESNDKLHHQSEETRKTIYQNLADINQIEEKLLPEISSFQNKVEVNVVSNIELKKTITNIWQDVIHTDRFNSSYYNSKSKELNKTPLDTNEATSSNLSQSDANSFIDTTNTKKFSSLGGDSLQFVQVYQRYQLLFSLDTEKLPTRLLLECDTIDEHLKILAPLIKQSVQPQQWHPLHIKISKTFSMIHFFNIITCFFVCNF
jgi:dGTP triphosphohydrolase